MLECQSCTEEARFKELIGELRKELHYWKVYLTSSVYAATNEYTLADIATEPFLLLADYTGATFTSFPHVKQYVDRVKSRKAVAKVLQLHEEAGMSQLDVFGGAI